MGHSRILCMGVPTIQQVRETAAAINRRKGLYNQAVAMRDERFTQKFHLLDL